MPEGGQETPGGLLGCGRFLSDHSFLIRVVGNVDIFETYKEALRAAYAAHAFQRARGQYPKAPEDPVPEFLGKVPVHVWSGKPLRFEPIEGGLWIRIDQPAGGADNASVSPEERIYEYEFALGAAYTEKQRREAAELGPIDYTKTGWRNSGTNPEEDAAAKEDK